MIDISMQYLGLKLSGPIVVASTPLSESIDNIRHMEDAGASAIVLTSLFEEQLALESRTLDEDLSRGTDSFAESLGYLPDLADYRMTHEVYLEHLRRAREAVAIPVLASLNGATPGGWVRFAKEMEQAGAHAIELNTYALATDAQPDLGQPRTATARPGVERLPGRQGSCGRQAVAVLHQHSESRCRLQEAGAAGVVSLQSLLSARLRYRGP